MRLTRGRRQTLRSKARRKILNLLKEFDGKCAWCDRDIVSRKQVKGKIIHDENRNAITWVTQDGLIVISILATVDHLTPISEGGCSSIWNLVPSCRSCNNKRQHYMHSKRFLIRETVWRLRERIMRDKTPTLESIVVGT